MNLSYLKNILTTFTILLLVIFQAKAQCPPGGVTLDTQAKVNDFLAQYPNCTEIAGNLYIGKNSGLSDITDLSPLNNLVSVNGWIAIYHTSLTSINGLTNLTTVEEDMDIWNNSLLTSINGFSNLTTIKGLDIRNNTSLTSISGFNSLTEIGLLNFTNLSNPSLQSISGFDALTQIVGNFELWQNPSLQSIGGFNALTQITGKFELRENPNLESFVGFGNLNGIGQFIYFNDTKIANITGLNNLESVGGFMVFEGNTELTNFDFLNSLTNIGQNFAIRNHPQLQNLNGLSNLTTVNGRVQILNNTVLNDISGLQNIDPESISELGLILKNNPALSVCNLPNFCTYLAGSGARDISGNLAECLNEAAVIVACTPAQCPEGDVRLRTQSDVDQFLATYPNCTEIEGLLRIGGDPGVLSDVTDVSPLHNITNIGGTLFIQYNGVLQNLDGLNISTVGGNLYIGGGDESITNLQLQNLNGLSSLTSLGGYLSISNNTSLIHVNGLSNLTSIGSFLEIEGNAVLQSLDGLDNLISLAADLTIRKNGSMTNVNGLSGLTTMSGWLTIEDNDVLNDISGLQNIITGIGNLKIKNNPVLSVCNLPNFCTYLAGSGARDISDNLAECLDEAAVINACNPPLCPTGDVRLRTQAGVDQFVANYPACTEIEGLLRIGADDGSISDITDISGLSNLNKIGTILFIQNTGVLQNLNGLQGLTQLGGRLFVGHNAQLQNLDGLNNISNINGEIGIINNATLNNIQGIRNIDPFKFVGLYIENNPVLAVCNLPNFCTYLANPASTHPRSITGNLAECVNEAAVIVACTPAQCPEGDVDLTTQAAVNQFLIDYPNCSEIAGRLVIGAYQEDSPSNITDISALSNIKRVEGPIYIQNNGVLQNLDGLNGLVSVGEFVNFIDNASLTHINGLSNLSSVGGFVNVQNNATLSDLSGLGGIIEIDGFLQILNNSSLTHINGLNNVTSVAGALNIQENSALTNLNGLTQVLNIGGFLQVWNNASLTDISGLKNISSTSITADGLYIIENPSLEVCNLPNFCDYLSNPESTHPRTIANNAGDCISEQTVKTACISSTEGIDVTQFSVYPNPVIGILNIAYNKNINNISVHSILGQTMMFKDIGSTEASIDMSTLSSGNYYIKVFTESGVITVKVFKP